MQTTSVDVTSLKHVQEWVPQMEVSIITIAREENRERQQAADQAAQTQQDESIRNNIHLGGNC